MTRFNLSHVEMRHLRYFVAVAEAGSFRAAAHRLRTSQPPLSRQIRQLEDLLGTPLLKRKPRGVETTSAGAILLAEARNILQLVEAGLARTQLAARGQLGRLDVGVFGSAVFDLIPRILLEFRRRNPQVELALHSMDRQAQIRALRERRLTVGFNRFFDSYPDLVCQVVHRESLVVALTPGHRLATRRRVAFADLADEPLVLHPRSARPNFIDLVLQQFDARGLRPRIEQEVDDVVTALSLVSCGLGITLVPEAATNLKLPGLTFVPLEKIGARIDLCLIRRLDDDSPLTRAFVDCVETVRRTR